MKYHKHETVQTDVCLDLAQFYHIPGVYRDGYALEIRIPNIIIFNTVYMLIQTKTDMDN